MSSYALKPAEETEDSKMIPENQQIPDIDISKIDKMDPIFAEMQKVQVLIEKVVVKTSVYELLKVDFVAYKKIVQVRQAEEIELLDHKIVGDDVKREKQKFVKFSKFFQDIYKQYDKIHKTLSKNNNDKVERIQKQIYMNYEEGSTSAMKMEEELMREYNEVLVNNSRRNMLFDDNKPDIDQPDKIMNFKIIQQIYDYLKYQTWFRLLPGSEKLDVITVFIKKFEDLILGKVQKYNPQEHSDTNHRVSTIKKVKANQRVYTQQALIKQSELICKKNAEKLKQKKQRAEKLRDQLNCEVEYDENGQPRNKTMDSKGGYNMKLSRKKDSKLQNGNGNEPDLEKRPKTSQ